jgi:parallel beta-helix repeat protein
LLPALSSYREPGGLFIRKVRAEWTGGPKETNGGYGLYPVQCADVLIEECTIRGASDAGIDVGQSENIIVKRNRVERNVAGIDIENCTRADIHGNEATDNAGGVLIFTMPDSPKKDGRHRRLFKNKAIANESRYTTITLPPTQPKLPAAQSTFNGWELTATMSARGKPRT